MIRPFFLACAALISSHADPAVAESEFQQWLSVSAKSDLAESIAVQGEISARFGDERGGLYQLDTSLLLGYRLTDKVTAWAGYVHNANYAAANVVAIERRAREQITIDNFMSLGTAKFSTRMRLEQRWRDGVEGVGWRARPQLKVAVPLGSKAAPTLNVSAEPFINLNTTGFQSTPGLDRVRSVVSLTMPVSPAVRVEAGYLNQHRFIRRGEDRYEHALTAALALSF